MMTISQWEVSSECPERCPNRLSRTKTTTSWWKHKQKHTSEARVDTKMAATFSSSRPIRTVPLRPICSVRLRAFWVADLRVSECFLRSILATASSPVEAMASWGCWWQPWPCCSLQSQNISGTRTNWLVDDWCIDFEVKLKVSLVL